MQQRLLVPARAADASSSSDAARAQSLSSRLVNTLVAHHMQAERLENSLIVFMPETGLTPETVRALVSLFTIFTFALWECALHL